MEFFTIRRIVEEQFAHVRKTTPEVTEAGLRTLVTLAAIARVDVPIPSTPVLKGYEASTGHFGGLPKHEHVSSQAPAIPLFERHTGRRALRTPRPSRRPQDNNS